MCREEERRCVVCMLVRSFERERDNVKLSIRLGPGSDVATRHSFKDETKNPKWRPNFRLATTFH